MKITRTGAMAAVALTGTLALTACGSDNNSGTSGGSGSTPAAAGTCGSGTLNSEGSTAQLFAIQQAISGYQGQCSGVTVNYNGTGSGAGVKQLIAGQVPFAGTDSALSKTPAAGATQSEVDQATATCGAPAINIPLVAGGISMAYNVKGVTNLNLTSDVLAKIFKGQITTWNDPAIAAANSGVSLPSEPIKVFFRSDSSGTTQNLSAFLHAKAPAVWTDAPDKAWKGTGEGKNGSGEVAKSVSGTEGGIGYMEVSYATNNKLNSASIDGLAPQGDALTKSVAAGKVATDSNNDTRVTFDYTNPPAGGYPIPIVTYEAVCSKYKDATVGKNVKAFLTYLASDANQSAIGKIGYVPLPSALKTPATTAINAIS